MSSTSTYALNQRINGLEAQVNTIIDDLQPYPIGDIARLNIAQDWTAIQTFNVLPESAIVPTTANQLVNKTYADSLVPSPINAVLIAGNQTLTTGVKTFTNLPESIAVPTTNAQLVNKLYVDGLTPATPTITQVLTAGNNGLDVSQIFSATASTITTNIDNAEVQIIDSVSGVNSLLEYDKLTIDDGGGDIHIVDSGGDVITGANASGGTITNTITKSSLNIADIAPAPAWSYQSTLDIVQPFGSQLHFTGVYNPGGYTLDTTYGSNSITQSFPVVPPTFSDYTITTQGDLLIVSPNVDITASTLTFNGNPVLTSTPSWSDTLTISSNANQSISLNGFNIGGVNDIVLNTINGNPYPIATPSWNDTLNVNPNATQSINLSGNNIDGVNNIVLNTINGLPPGSSPNLQQVLNVGNNAGGQQITNLNALFVGSTTLYDNALTFGSAGDISNLATINGIAYPPPTSYLDLNQVLATGNNAGGQNITYVGDIALSTINSAPYPPTYATPDLNSVLSAGNNANSQNITSVNDITLYSINGTPYPPYPFAPYGLYETLNYNNNAYGLNMTGINNINLSTINNSSYPPTTSQNLQQVLAVGNDAGGQSIASCPSIQGTSGLNLEAQGGDVNITAQSGGVYVYSNNGNSIQLTSAYNATINATNSNFTATANSVDILSVQNLNVISSGSTVVINSATGTSITSGGDINVNASTGLYIFANMPTSSAGLPAGAIYSAGGVLMIV